MLNVITPFICEKMYLNFKDAFGLQEDSVNMLDWPAVNEKDINAELEKNMANASAVAQAILSARDKIQLGVRWPVKSVEVITKSDDIFIAVEILEDLIKRQTNVKEVHVHKEYPLIKKTAKLNFDALKVDFRDLTPKIIAKFSTESPKKIMDALDKTGKVDLIIDAVKISLYEQHFQINRDVPNNLIEAEIKGGFVYLNKTRTEDLDAEGYARELMRRVQQARKNAGLEKADSVVLYIKADDDLCKMLKPWEDLIQKKVGASKMKIGTEGPAKKHAFESEEKVKDKKFSVHFDKA